MVRFDSSDPDRLHWDEHVQRGIELRSAADGAQWDLGILAVSVQSTYGGNDLRKFADEIGINVDVLEDYRYIADRFPGRPENVVFGVLRAIAKFENRDEWLERAIRERWTVSRARREAALTTEEKPPADDQGSKRNLGFKPSTDRIVNRFTAITASFEQLREDEESEDAEPEQMARAIASSNERRRAVEHAVARATQFVDKWVAILEIEIETNVDDFESA